jgi:hypothetical protein
MTYRGKPFPITGTIEERAALLDPYDRHEGYFRTFSGKSSD